VGNIKSYKLLEVHTTSHMPVVNFVLGECFPKIGSNQVALILKITAALPEYIINLPQSPNIHHNLYSLSQKNRVPSPLKATGFLTAQRYNLLMRITSRRKDFGYGLPGYYSVHQWGYGCFFVGFYGSSASKKDPDFKSFWGSSSW
jgi:hypothetical protein